MALCFIRSTYPLPLHHPLCGRSPSPSEMGEDFGVVQSTSVCPERSRGTLNTALGKTRASVLLPAQVTEQR
ncbi:hypothetical protein C7451_103272 [Blastomonas natatoria]|uniref:Uncharacterized protein n=1 Tax=Blastomonas natatoria TaxID=34015 RepID=A0A2V3VAK2_9SPHN|nr:hypothetical protein C7451_103272 [Blastomonas natatoria]